MRSNPSSWIKTLTQLGFARKRRRRAKSSLAFGRRPSVESLESRLMLAVTVNTLEDDVASGNGLTSLREAIAAVTPQNNEINFDASLVGGVIRLSGPELVISSSLQIKGLGAGSLTVDAGGDSRVFNVAGGTTVLIKDLTITGGAVSGSSASDGGGILNAGNLTLDSVVVAGNKSGDEGGGVHSRNVGGQIASLSIVNSTIRNNEGRFGAGLNVDVAGGAMVIDRSSIYDNHRGANEYAEGGGLRFHGTSGTATIKHSTFSGNESVYSGGIRVWDTTIPLEISNVTIANNVGDLSGGVHVIYTGSTPPTPPVIVNNTLVATNKTRAGAAADLAGVLNPQSTSNIFAAAVSTNLTPAELYNQIGTPADTINARLAPLGNYGGSSMTHALLPGSPAIDQAHDTKVLLATGAWLDQRGYQRYVDEATVPNSAVGSVDIGAVEIGNQVVWDGADFNGDGRGDRLFYSPYTHAFVVAEGAANAQDWTASHWGAVGVQETANWTEFIAGDFNGDGRDDVLLRDGATNAWSLAVSDGAAFLVHSLGITGAWSEKFVGDFDKDGSEELLVRASPSSNWLVLNYDDIAGGNLVDTGNGSMLAPGVVLYVGDANRDGRDDLIRREASDGSWFVSLSGLNADGTGAFGGATNWGRWFDPGFVGGVLDVDAPMDTFLDTFAWIYNNVELELYMGLMKGPEATRQTKAANDWDQAGLLEKELQALSFVAPGNVKIASGKVRVSVDKLRDWLGVTSTVAAIHVMRNTFDKTAKPYDAAGQPLSDANAGLAATIEFNHGWVRAKVPTATGFDWIDLDPSWKFKERQTGVTLLETQNLYVNPDGPNPPQGLFDEFEYLLLDPLKDHSLPIEFYQDQLQEWLSKSANHQGKSLADVAYDGPIIAKQFARLPAGLGEGVSVVAGSSSEYEDLSAIYANSSFAEQLTHRVNIKLDRYVSENSWTQEWAPHQLLMPRDSLKTIQVTYAAENGSPLNDVNSIAAENSLRFWSRLVVDGAVVSGKTSTSAIPEGQGVRLTIENLAPRRFMPGGAVADDFDRTHSFVREAGQILAVGLNANQFSRDSLVAMQAAMLAAVGSNTTVTTLLPAIDDLASYAIAKYWSDLTRDNKAVDQLTRSVGGQQWVGSGIVTADAKLLTAPGSSNVRIDYVPYGIAPKNLGIDLPNINHVAMHTDSGVVNREAVQLAGYNSSAREHTIVEEVISSPSISTMKGLQRAAQQDLGITSSNTRTSSDAIIVIKSTRTTATDPWIHRHVANWYVNGSGVAINGIANLLIDSESDLTNSTNGPLRHHEGTTATKLGQKIWKFLHDLDDENVNPELENNSNVLEVTVLAPTGRTNLVDDEWGNLANYVANSNNWVGGVYVAEIPGISTGYIIVESDATSGGYAGNKTLSPPPTLPPINFTNYTSAGDPVNVANGNMYRDETDIVFPNVGVPLTFSRHYDSQSKDDFGMGVGWMYTFGDLLILHDNGTPTLSDDNDSTLVWIASDGKRHTFGKNGNKYDVPTSLQGDIKYTNASGVEFDAIPSGGWVGFRFKDRQGIEHHFEKVTLPQSSKSVVGRLRSIVDRNGHGVLVNYDTTIANTRRLTYVQDIHATGTPPTHGIGFAYLPGTELIQTASKYFGGNVGNWLYSYTDVTGTGTASSKRLIKAEGANVGIMDDLYQETTARPTVQYLYNTQAEHFANGLIQRITEPNGAWHEYEYFANGRVFRVRQGDIEQLLDNPKVETQTFSYNVIRNATEFTDERGNIETYVHQDNGLLVKQIHADRTQMEYEWGETGSIEEFLMLSTTDERGAVEKFDYYDSSTAGIDTFKYGQLYRSTAKHYPGQTPLVTQYNYDRPWASGTNAKPHIVDLTSVVVDPDSSVLDLSSSYYKGQKLTTSFDYYPIGHDSYGRLWKTTDPQGNVTELTYYSTTDGLAYRQGLLKSQLRPAVEVAAGGTIHHETALDYDSAGNVVSTKTDGSNETTASYNSLGQPLRSSDATHVSTHAVYDGLGRVIETGFGEWGQPVNPIDAFTTKFKYDAVGRVRESTDPLGRVTRFEYDGRGRLHKTINPDKTTREHIYDALGNCIAITDELGRTTRFVYDNRNRRIQTIHADGSVERVRYDGTGQITASIGALGATTTFRYDAVGRLLETKMPDPVTGLAIASSPTTTNKYDKVGNLIQAIDPEANVTQFEYDKLGRVVQSRTLKGVNGDRNSTTLEPASQNSLVTLWTTEYDAVGNIKRATVYGVTDFATATPAPPANVLENPTVLIATHPNLVQVAKTVYDAFGRPEKVTNADSTTTQIKYDAAGRVWKVYDELGNDAQLRYTEHEYDSTTGRLKRTISPDPDGVGAGNPLQRPETKFEYDAVGNRTKVIDPRGFATTFEYDAFNRVVATVDALGNRARSVYDTAGQMVESIDALGRAAYTRYDDRGRVLLTRAADPDDALTGGTPPTKRFEYDSAGRVQFETDPRGYRTEYVRDALGRVIKERRVESLVIDNGDSEFVINHGNGSGTVVPDTTAYGGDALLLSPPGTPGQPAEVLYTFNDLKAGTYRIAATWKSHQSAGVTVRAFLSDVWNETMPAAQVLPYDVATPAYLQQAPPASFYRSDDGRWRGWTELSSEFVLDVGEVSGPRSIAVILSGAGTLPLYVDAVRLEWVEESAFSYDANGNLLSGTDANGNTTTRAYDELDRVRQVTLPDPDDEGPGSLPTPGALIAPQTTTFYDGYGNVERVEERRDNVAANKRTTAYEYDQRNRRTSETLDSGVGSTYLNLRTEFEYDAAGNLEQRTELPGHATLQRITTYKYDALNRVTRETFNSDLNAAADSPSERVAVTTYDAAGNVTLVEQNPLGDPRLLSTAFEYDALGRTIGQTETGTLGVTETRPTRFVYDAVGNTTATSDPLGHLSTSVYDRLDRRTMAVDPDPDGSAGSGEAHYTRFSYDVVGNLVRRNNGDVEIDRFVYDAAGRLVRSFDGRGDETRRRYDAAGNLLRLVDPAGNWTTYAYDKLDRLKSETNVFGSRLYVYDNRGNLAMEVDRNGRATRTTYDRLDRPFNEYWYANETDARAFNVSTASTAHSDATTSFYDALGRLIEQQYVRRKLDGTYSLDYRFTTSWAYDGLDRVVEESNQTKQPAPNDLSSSGVPATKTAYSYSFNTTYNIVEKKQYVGGVAQTQTYEHYGPFDELRYVINQGLGGGLTFARADAEFVYDRSGALQESYRKTDFDSGPFNNFRNFVKTTYGYDGAGRLSSLAHEARRNPGSWGSYQPLVGFTYQYDEADRISSLGTDWNTSFAGLTTRSDAAETFTYDNAGQLEAVTDALSAAFSSYGYFANGNRSTVNEGGVNELISSGPGNRVTGDGAFTYHYDNEGNLIERKVSGTLSQRLAWDHRNRLAKVENFDASGNLTETIDYRYNAAGGLVRRSVDPAGTPPAVIEQYVLEGGRRALTLAGGTTSATVSRRYQYGVTGEVLYDQVFDATGQSAERYEPLGDHQHSTRILLEHAGPNDLGAAQVHKTVEYAPFGSTLNVRDVNGATAALDTVFGHHGSVTDGATGLQFKGGRWYSPDLGQFVSTDPIGYAGGDSNHYRFAGNDPVNFADPSGLSQSGHPLAGGFAGSKTSQSLIPPGSTLGGPQIGTSIFAGMGLPTSTGRASASTGQSVARIGGGSVSIGGRSLQDWERAHQLASATRPTPVTIGDIDRFQFPSTGPSTFNVMQG